MQNWKIALEAAYIFGICVWIAGMWEERDRLREENRRLKTELLSRQPWRRYTKAYRKNRKAS